MARENRENDQMQEGKKKNRISDILWKLAMLVFICIFVVSAVKLITIFWNYHKADKVADAFMIFKPTTNILDGVGEIDLSKDETPRVNPSLIEMMNQYPDVCGWITIADTNLDYPIALGEDNEYYLHRALDGQETTYGTPFMDYRGQRDFSSVNNIIYGHHTKTKKMFTVLVNFKNKDFFDEHTNAVLFVPDDTCRLEIMACLLIRSDDEVIYNPYVDQETFVNHVKSNAMYYRETELAEGDTFLTLSTCSYEFENARTVLVAKIVKNDSEK